MERVELLNRPRGIEFERKPMPHVNRKPLSVVTNPIVKGIDQFDHFFSRFPFAGKIAITPSVVNTRLEQDRKTKEVRIAKSIGLLSLFVLAHAFQADLGINALSRLQYESITGNPIVDLQAIIDSLYVLVNAGAVICQTRLLTKMVGEISKVRTLKNTTRSWSEALENSFSPKHSREFYTDNERSKMTTVTLGGQLLFLASNAI